MDKILDNRGVWGILIVISVILFYSIFAFTYSDISLITGYSVIEEQWEHSLQVSASVNDSVITETITFDNYKPSNCQDGIIVMNDNNSIDYEIINSTYENNSCIEATIQFNNIIYQNNTNITEPVNNTLINDTNVTEPTNQTIINDTNTSEFTNQTNITEPEINDTNTTIPEESINDSNTTLPEDTNDTILDNTTLDNETFQENTSFDNDTIEDINETTEDTNITEPETNITEPQINEAEENINNDTEEQEETEEDSSEQDIEEIEDQSEQEDSEEDESESENQNPIEEEDSGGESEESEDQEDEDSERDEEETEETAEEESEQEDSEDDESEESEEAESEESEEEAEEIEEADQEAQEDAEEDSGDSITGAIIAFLTGDTENTTTTYTIYYGRIQEDLNLIINYSQLKQGEVIIDEPVNWTQNITIYNPSNFTTISREEELDLPSDASNIKIISDSEIVVDSRMYFVNLEPKEKIEVELFFQTSPLRLEIQNSTLNLSQLLPPEAKEIKVFSGSHLVGSYRTLREANINLPGGKKKVSVYHNSSLSYSNITISLPYEEGMSLTKIVEGQEVNATENVEISGGELIWLIQTF